jgi:DNA-binding transcriptional LysR family regulator
MKLSSKRNLPSIANIESFLSVARLGSITAAAEELFLTQGAVSKQVLELEKFVGTSLFTRTAQGLHLTPSGKALFERVSPLISDLADAFVNARSTRSVVNISVPPSFGMELVTPNLSTFQEENPSMLLNLHSRTGEVDLEKEGLDAAVVLGEPRSTAYRTERLFVPILFPYVSPALLHGAPSGLTVMQHCKLIGLVTMPAAWSEYFAGLNLAYQPSMVGTNHSLLSTAAQAVISGYGIAMLPEYVADQHVRARLMVRITDSPYLGSKPYFLVARRQVSESEEFRRFREWLLKLLTQKGLMSTV